MIIKKILLSILSVLLGVTFLYSAYTKLMPIQTFEYTLVEFVHMPWWMAALSSRLLVGAEVALGILLLFNIYGSGKWVLKLSLLILVLFSIYLVYLWAAVGNDVNCGCFGDAIWMSPSSSLIKNGIMLLAIILLMKFQNGISQQSVTSLFLKQYRSTQKKGYRKLYNLSGRKFFGHLAKIVAVLVMLFPFITEPIPAVKPAFLMKDKYELDLSPLYNPERPQPTVNLRAGKHILAFMSLTCPHCKTAAHKLQLIHRNNPEISVFFVLNGDSINLEKFWKNTNSKSIPYSMLKGKAFIDYTGGSVPTIYYINNGWVDAKPENYNEVNQSNIEKWLSESFTAK